MDENLRARILEQYPELHELCHRNRLVASYLALALDGKLSFERALVLLVVAQDSVVWHCIKGETDKLMEEVRRISLDPIHSEEK